MSDALEQAIVARVQRGDVRVPAYPPSAGKLQRVLSRTGFSIDEVVKVLRSDAVLAATTLRLANSAFYSRGEVASTLTSAVVRIGSHQLHRLSVAAGTQRVFASPGPLASLRRRAWRQALMSAAICECLAQARGDGAEESFVAGLLHDIGRVLAITVLEELGATDEAAAWKLVERFHVELGMVIAAKWMLPPALEAVIADHHVRDGAGDDSVLRRVQASDLVVALLEETPSVTAERLRDVFVLTDAESRLLAAKIPTMPEFVEAFGVNQVAQGGATFSVPVAAPSMAQGADPTRRVQLHAVGPRPLDAELVVGCETELTVNAASPGRANWLVQVKFEEMMFWASVRGSAPSKTGGYDWELKPFALTAEVAQKWSVFTEALPRAA